MKSRIPEIAEHFVGWLQEATKQNDGRWVEAVQRLTGNKKGDAWCASFVTMLLDIAYRGKNPLPITASCDVLLEDARRRGWLHPVPHVGDVFLVMKSEHDAVHTGVVTSVDLAGVRTIEGNTNDDGSREGYGVFARTRPLAHLLFIRLPA